MVQSKSRAPAAAPSRVSNKTTFSVSCDPADLLAINARAASLGLDRSTYIMALARQDTSTPREFTIHPKSKA